jgi:hypothetical protein
MSERYKFFGGRKKGMVLWRCSVLFFRVVWLERTKRIFAEARGQDVDQLWDRVHFWASLWVLVSSQFRDYSFRSFFIIGTQL